MKYKNFKYLGKSNGIDIATVDVESGFLFKKVETKKIFKKFVYWQFFDSGMYTDGSAVERLEDACMAEEAAKRLL